MSYLADQILNFYAKVDFKGNLPPNIGMMNPYRESEDIKQICNAFYHKYYNDNASRTLILGINPGRLGAGSTGIPFTDTKRLNDNCGIPYHGSVTHEPSSVYMYEMIEAYGGPELFYSHFYINSVCPLGFVKTDGLRTVNYNYYDSRELESSLFQFICDNIQTQIKLAGKNEICYCLGTGKNYRYLNQLNEKFKFFEQVIPLEHPRYIMQYKSSLKDKYIDDYLKKLKSYK